MVLGCTHLCLSPAAALFAKQVHFCIVLNAAHTSWHTLVQGVPWTRGVDVVRCGGNMEHGISGGTYTCDTNKRPQSYPQAGVPPAKRSGCCVRIRLQRSLLPTAFTTYCPLIRPSARQPWRGEGGDVAFSQTRPTNEHNPHTQPQQPASPSGGWGVCSFPSNCLASAQQTSNPWHEALLHCSVLGQKWACTATKADTIIRVTSLFG